MLRVVSLVVAPFFLASCATPTPLGRDELVQYGKTFLEQQKPAGGADVPAEPWTLERALARALDSNVEYRIGKLEAAIATGNRKLASMEMLPRVTAEAGYRRRSNLLGSYSESVSGSGVTLVPSTSSDRESETASGVLSWDILDFGLAYFRSRTLGQQELIAEENRRRVSQSLVRDLVYTYWQAWSFEQLAPELAAMRSDVEGLLQQSEEIIRLRLGDPVKAIELRSGLLLMLKRIDAVALQLDQSRDELRRLLDLPADAPVSLSATDPFAGESATVPRVAGLRQWQYAALLHRPEVRQAIYDMRSARNDSRATMLELVPRLALGTGSYYDGNRYLVNNAWEETSVGLSWDLVRLAGYPMARRQAKRNVELSELRWQVQASAVIAQVAVAEKAFQSSERLWCISRNLVRLDEKRREVMSARSAASAIDQLTLLRSRLDNLLLRAESGLQYAEHERARWTLLLSSGLIELPAVKEGEEPEPVLRAWLGDIDGNLVERELASVAEAFGLPPEANAESSAPAGVACP